MGLSAIFKVGGDFERPRKAEMPFNFLLLKQLVMDLIVKSTFSRCNNTTTNPCFDKNNNKHIELLWISTFMASKGILSRTQTEKLRLSRAKRENIIRQIAFSLASYPETLAQASFLKTNYKVLIRRMFSLIISPTIPFLTLDSKRSNTRTLSAVIAAWHCFLNWSVSLI